MSKSQALGPGILMATASVGGSHLVAATQAGALFGWQLLWLIIAVNVLKYPFFRFGVEYTLRTNQSLVQGYKDKNPSLFYLFFIVNLLAAVVNTAGVLLITAALLQYILPGDLSLTTLSFGLLFVCLGILIFGHYKLLDNSSKVIMVFLCIATAAAFIVALMNGPAHPTPQVAPSPYELALLGFMVALMGWMPAPIEVSAINSLWLKSKLKTANLTRRQSLFDFNLGYAMMLILALVFFALGVLLQYGQEQKIELAGVAFSKQLIDMYAMTIGEWSRWLIAVVAFLCMFGTTITVLDGYARTLDESLKIIKPHNYKHSLSLLIGLQSALGMIVVLFFKGNLKEMLMFAMTMAFLTTPFFAWLNLSLIKGEIYKSLPKPVKVLSTLGLIYLVSFSLLFVVWRWVI
ncbi:membrane protein [Pseudoalteromonas luteoviolacea]|uniref:Membrane protein n=1 Tax=Pseudoalteromonas luteoviolacea TaxID=43657 RepID=A0A0C1QAT4_9GAMM|nr:divalent metal cation transporter [Pseudoalteromonas luteoviolacea]KID57756.1 membrane protein [Pseudoalteromonas luteoviolacea]